MQVGVGIVGGGRLFKPPVARILKLNKPGDRPVTRQRMEPGLVNKAVFVAGVFALEVCDLTAEAANPIANPGDKRRLDG